MRTRTFVFLTLVCIAGCGSADISGDYSVALTNRENGCNLSNWTVGDMTNGIPFSITQNGSAATGSVGGITGGLLELFVGSRNFTGTVSGTSFTLLLEGSRHMQMGTCDYTANVEALGKIEGDAITGTLTYYYETDGAMDCGNLGTCRSVQAFSGARAPR